MAVEALNDHWIRGHEPAVILLPAPGVSPSATPNWPKFSMERGKCQVVAGLVGDENADRPVRGLLGILGEPRG